MSTPAATPREPGAMTPTPLMERQIADYWWLWLIVGCAWIIAALIVLQFDQASITTIGIIVGIMFTFAGLQQLFIAAIADSYRWLWLIVGVFFVGSGIYCFVNPEKTFAGLADALGFLFLLVGLWWTLRAFLEMDTNPVWWLGLIGGILMIVLAFWTSGQFFLERAYVLLVFAGIWALMQGITDILRAFQLRAVRELV